MATQQAPSVVIDYFASLTLLDKEHKPTAAKPILLRDEVTTIGNDPELSQVVLDDPALAGAHARIQCYKDGKAKITDMQTEAGVWVNFRQIGDKPVELRHGDIIHLGKSEFRFKTREKTASTVDKTTSADNDLASVV